MTDSVFLSFSSRDKDFVRPLIAQLRMQGFAVWDYSAVDEQITVGTLIPQRLEKEIDSRQWFVPLITINSNHPETGLYTRHELNHAISRKRHTQGRVLPIIVETAQLRLCRKVWDTDPLYAPIRHRRYISLNDSNSDQIITTVASLCIAMGRRYTAPFPTDSKLPFYDRFVTEIRDFLQQPCPNEYPRDHDTNALHTALSIIIGQCMLAYEKGDYSRAALCIGHFIDTLVLNFGRCSLCYTHIVKGTIDLHQNNLDGAESAFTAARAINPGNGTAWGGLGMVALARKAYDDAVDCFEKALDLPGNDTVNDRINLAAALLSAGKSLPAELADFVLNVELSAIESRFHPTVQSVQAGVWLQSGQPEKTLDAVALIFDKMQTLPYSLLLFAAIAARAMHNTGRILSCIRRARRSRCTASETAALYDLYADALCVDGDISAAMRVYQKILTRPPYRNRRYCVKLARLYNHVGDVSARDSLCRTIIDTKEFRIPATKDECYQTGYAHFLMGNTALARYEHARSEMEEWYE